MRVYVNEHGFKIKLLFFLNLPPQRVLAFQPNNVEKTFLTLWNRPDCSYYQLKNIRALLGTS